MNRARLVFSFFMVASLAGCASTSSSSASYVPLAEQTVGPIFVTQSDLPADLEYEVIGLIKANARQGYDSAESLYPMLVDEARKVGANAVIKVYGGRTVSAFSWAAPYAGGTAVKISNTEALEKADGKFF
jgi:uncharacterized protein YbjQ (UPF0145 family)